MNEIYHDDMAVELKQTQGKDDQGPPPIFSIWVRGRVGGPIADRQGYLCEKDRLLFFYSQQEAERRIKDLWGLCVNRTPAADYDCVKYDAERASIRIQLEEVKALELKPDFDPLRYEILERMYGNTGGGCMVGTVQVYLPELEKTVWVNCNDEGVTVASADFVWNEDHSESWEHTDDVELFSLAYQESGPEDAGPWLPMIREALVYTIEQEVAQRRSVRAFWLPVDWLPDMYRQTVEPEYLAWLQARNESAAIGKDGRIIIDHTYRWESRMGMMEQQ